MKKLSYILLKFNARSDELSPRFPNLQEVNLKKNKQWLKTYVYVIRSLRIKAM